MDSMRWYLSCPIRNRILISFVALIHDVAVRLHCLPCRCMAVGQWQDFRREVAGVANVAQCLRHGRDVDVAEADRPTVAISKMDISEALACRTQRVRERSLLEVHVEQVTQ